MRLGIDFGTTRTLVACADRGNYPIVSFLDDEGEAHEHFPSVVAERDGRLVYGLAAVAAEREGAPSLRSFKRLLGERDVRGDTRVRIGESETTLLALVSGYLEALRHALDTRSNMPKKARGVVHECVVAVPAHAHLTQRFLTLEAFRRAGFVVKALMNEPSAAGFEFTHRHATSVSSKRTTVLVYDLGGGTFDASLVKVDGGHHRVVSSLGHPRLGGDDFDALLATLACEAAGVSEDVLSSSARAELLEHCRDAKERLSPNTRRIVVEQPFAATVPVSSFSERAASLVALSLEIMAPLVSGLDDDRVAATDELAGVYVVGGASGLPLVARMLKERFGRRVHRSPYPAASTAIGLAIAADDDRGFTISERFARSVGVFREKDAGRALAIDAILSPDEALPSSGTRVITRRYQAIHNIGHYRFVELPASHDDAREPSAFVPLGDVLFAFDPALRGRSDLGAIDVVRRDVGVPVEERYVIDANGLVSLEIEDLARGHVERFALGGA